MGNGAEVSLSSQREQTGDGERGARPPAIEPAPDESRRGFAVLLVALAPALAAIWTVPWFVTQDGLVHVYNAQILAWSFGTDSPFGSVYTVRWQPIPNWAGQLVLAGLVAGLPAWVADRIMTSVTLVGFAAATLWLRRRVAGGSDMRPAALLSALLAMNIAWLWGFSSFLLGACLFPITLGYWWSGRDRLGAGRIVVLSALLILGYFCHLVSLGLSVLGLIVLSVAGPLPVGPGSPWRRRCARLARTSVSFIPLVVLGFFYLRIARQGGRMHPVWRNLANPWSLADWGARLGWVDPLTLAIKDGLPFSDRVGWQFIVFAPVAWLSLAMVLWWYGRISAGPRAPAHQPSRGAADHEPISSLATDGMRDERKGWIVLAAILLVSGWVGPDSLGTAHGEFLPQRVVLFGLVALVPIFDVDPTRWPGRVAIAALLAALTVQSAIVWDYALYSDRTAGQIIRARNLVGRNKKIATLLVTTRGRFRANPLLHAENWLGVDTGNVVWNNYETLHYYFPVQFRAGISRPHAGDLELVSLHEDPEEQEDRRRDWERILASHADSIDVILFWKRDERLEEITKRWFEINYQRDDVQIFLRRRSRSRP
jgi:hypothetical protein